MNLLRWVGAGSLLLMTSACLVPQAQYDRLVTEYHSENQARVKLEAELARMENEASELHTRLNSAESSLAESGRMSQERINQLENALAEAQSVLNSPFAEYDGINIVGTAEGFTILMQDKLLFDVGSTNLREGGKDALRLIAQEIINSGYNEVRIDGHTDSDPVVKNIKQFPRGNHELASERALSVYEYLTKTQKVPTSTLSLAAFGPNRPLIPGDSEQAKAKNRRVEIHVVVPE